jgi:hypothetical protein
VFLMALLKLEQDLSRPQRFPTCPRSNRSQLELAINRITMLARSGEVTDRSEMPLATALDSAVGTDGPRKGLLIGAERK